MLANSKLLIRFRNMLKVNLVALFFQLLYNLLALRIKKAERPEELKPFNCLISSFILKINR